MVAAAPLASRETVIGIYIHIPFCRTLCPYCDFVKRRLPEGNVPESFIEALRREIETFEGPDEAATVFLGGGTPSLIAPASLERIIEALNQRFRLHTPTQDAKDPTRSSPLPQRGRGQGEGARSAKTSASHSQASGEEAAVHPSHSSHTSHPPSPEITLEANPDDVTPDLADAWKALGTNRVSLGVQSFDEEALRYLGRRHDADGARRACAIVADRFENWSMDLIFGAHPAGSFETTLREAARFQPPHISAYGLTYEPGTPFGQRSQEAIDEDTYLRLFWLVEQHLPVISRYEVSNFARPGYECRHNLIYWHNEEYAGFGPGAYAFVDGVRARNHTALHDYLDDPGGKAESLHLSKEEIRLETVIQHLRLRDGLPKAYYRQRFGREVRDDFGPILDDLLARSLIHENADTLSPTSRGFELNNEIGLALVS